MMTRLLLSTLIVCIGSCRNRPGIKKEKSILLSIHKAYHDAYLEKNIPAVLSNISPDFVVIQNGIIKKPVREESFKLFEGLFDQVDFIKHQDVSLPRFNLSNDALMATGIFEDMVITRNKLDASRQDTAFYASLAVYRKTNGQWQIETIAMTKTPDKGKRPGELSVNPKSIPDLLTGTWIHDQDSLATVQITSGIWNFMYAAKATTDDTFRISLTDKLPQFVNNTEKANFIILANKTDTMYYEILNLDKQVLSLLSYPSGRIHLYHRANSLSRQKI